MKLGLGSMTSVGKKPTLQDKREKKIGHFKHTLVEKRKLNCQQKDMLKCKIQNNGRRGFKACVNWRCQHAIRQVGTRNLLKCTFSSERIRNSPAVWALKTSRQGKTQQKQGNEGSKHSAEARTLSERKFETKRLNAGDTNPLP
jgi:hypothetical protein